MGVEMGVRIVMMIVDVRFDEPGTPTNSRLRLAFEEAQIEAVPIQQG
jgi:hypothetical protein